jgi:hypothetical protein
MNLNSRDVKCPLGKITHLFPDTQTQAVFQGTLKFTGMPIGTPAGVLVVLRKQLNPRKGTWKTWHLPSLCVPPTPWRIIVMTSRAQGTSIISVHLWYFKFFNINFFPGIFFFTNSSFCLLLERNKMRHECEHISPIQTFLLAHNDQSSLKSKLSSW